MNYLAPDFSSAALVDVQVDTLDRQPLEVPGTSAVIPQIAALTAMFRAAGRPIVHIVRLYRSDGSNVDLCRRAAVQAGAQMFAPGSSGSQLARGLVERQDSFALEPTRLLEGLAQEVGPAEVVMYKPRWGAFYQTPLEDHLRAHGVSAIVFCGCNFPNCPRASIYEADRRPGSPRRGDASLRPTSGTQGRQVQSTTGAPTAPAGRPAGDPPAERFELCRISAA